jgi:hypothetical protein
LGFCGPAQICCLRKRMRTGVRVKFVGMEIYATHFRARRAQATDPSDQVIDLGGQGTVSRARVVLRFLSGKILTAMNPAFQSGLTVATGQQESPAERTVSSRAYGVWVMFEKTFRYALCVFSRCRALGVSGGRGVLSRVNGLRLACACARVYVLGRRSGERGAVMSGRRDAWAAVGARRRRFDLEVTRGHRAVFALYDGCEFLPTSNQIPCHNLSHLARWIQRSIEQLLLAGVGAERFQIRVGLAGGLGSLESVRRREHAVEDPAERSRCTLPAEGLNPCGDRWTVPGGDGVTADSQWQEDLEDLRVLQRLAECEVVLRADHGQEVSPSPCRGIRSSLGVPRRGLSSPSL